MKAILFSHSWISVNRWITVRARWLNPLSARFWTPPAGNHQYNKQSRSLPPWLPPRRTKMISLWMSDQVIARATNYFI